MARVVVPAGWMPMRDARGAFTLAPCSGMGATTLAVDTPAMHGMAMAHGDHDRQERHPDTAGDHPCSGAGVAAAIATPFAMLLAVPSPRPGIVAPQPFVVTIGQGLAAPPPPPTGPPILV